MADVEALIALVWTTQREGESDLRIEYDGRRFSVAFTEYRAESDCPHRDDTAPIISAATLPAALTGYLAARAGQQPPPQLDGAEK